MKAWARFTVDVTTKSYIWIRLDKVMVVQRATAPGHVWITVEGSDDPYVVRGHLPVILERLGIADNKVVDMPAEEEEGE